VIGNDPNGVLTAAQRTNARFLQVQLQIMPNNIPNLNNLGDFIASLDYQYSSSSPFGSRWFVITSKCQPPEYLEHG
jgi:hypothetical protein